MQWKGLAGLGLGLLLVATVSAVSGGSGGLEAEWAVPTTQATVRDFGVVVRAVGELDSARATVVSSQVRGDRGKIIYLVADGTPVDRTDVLIRLDPTPFEEHIVQLRQVVQERAAAVATAEQTLALERNQAARDVKTAEFNARVTELDLLKLEKGEGPLELARLESQARKARKAFEEKSRYVKDLEGLAEQGYSNPTEIAQASGTAEEARQELEIAKRQFQSYGTYVLPTLLEQAKMRVARAQAEIDELGRGGELAVAKAAAALGQNREARAAAEAELAEVEAELARTVIRSPLSGMVVLQESFRQGERRKPRVGDVVLQNQPLIYVPDVSRMVVETHIRELDLHNVAVGMPATVIVDAYPGLRLAGMVRSIGVMAEARHHVPGGDKAFRTVLELHDGDARLRPGMTARIEIDSAQLREALAVPVHAVFIQDGRAYCYVGSGSRFQLREVALGAQSEDWAQILRGLRAGERVALVRPPPDRVRGERALPAAPAAS